MSTELGAVQTASQKVEHFGLWFGAFAAPTESEVQGFGADLKLLTFAMMVLPQVWDWYLRWRERRRGFYTKWEIDLLSVAASFCWEETGWLRQMPRLAANLREIDDSFRPGTLQRLRATGTAPVTGCIATPVGASRKSTGWRVSIATRSSPS